MITHVAIIFNDKMWSLPRPNRHHHVIHQIHLDTDATDIYGDQGFLDHDGNFLDRPTALTHAISCNQLLTNRPIHDDWLYSENVW